MILSVVIEVAVRQPDEYRRPTLVTLIKSATTKTQRESPAEFAGILPTFTTSDERYSAGCNAVMKVLAAVAKYN